MKTWHIENAVVVAVLMTVWWLTSHRPIELIGSGAVFCGFCHASIAERMREREAARPVPSVECHAKSVWFFVLKEIGWFAYFVLNHSWSAHPTSALFAAYPLWRKLWRRYHPMEQI